jgi:tetratricopeptide (TPR) repeat protein/transcriptional regulator with XRE-family HTH domain
MTDGDFGAVLRAGRRLAGLSQQELAEASGLSVRAISNLERGRTRWPYPDSVQRLADGIGLRDKARREFIAAAGRRLARASVEVGLAAEPPPRNGTRIVPRQLPAAVPAFVGRQEQLTAMTRAQHGPGDVGGITVITGTAGVGKTALAVHWAHHAAGRYPDGQLFVNLRGFDPSGPPVASADAIRVLLDALGVPVDRIPGSAEAQLGLYRSLLAGRKVLVLLDNARDAAQVRPLLPGNPSCRIVITSRDELAGLAATEAARLQRVDVLSHAEACQMLRQRLGSERVAAEPEAAAQIVQRCARLPLALSIAAARAAMRPDIPLARIASGLGQANALDAFRAGGDTAADVRAAFSWSYRALTAPARRLFRLLGLHPGGGVSTDAAASLAAVTPGKARDLLAELDRCHLLAADAHGRYAFHDLLRAYAGEQASRHETEADRTAALRRMLDHYLTTAVNAARLLNGQLLPITTPELAGGVRAEQFAARSAAQEWVDREYHVLLRLITTAAETGFDAHAWQLPWALRDTFEWRALWQDWDATHRIAAAAAERLGDQRAQALTYRNWGRCHVLLHRWDEADKYLQQAADLFEKMGDRHGRAAVLGNLSQAAALAGRYRHARDWAQRAHDLWAETEYAPGQAYSSINIGNCSVRLGEYDLGRQALARALEIFRSVGDKYGEAAAANGLGLACLGLRRYQQAIGYHREAADLVRGLDKPAAEAEILTDLGDAYWADGRVREADQTWRRAVVIYDELRHPNSDMVRARLSERMAVPALDGASAGTRRSTADP